MTTVEYAWAALTCNAAAALLLFAAAICHWRGR